MRGAGETGAAGRRRRIVGRPRVRAGALEHDRRSGGAGARAAGGRRHLHLARAQRRQRPAVVRAQPGRPVAPTLLDAVRETIEIGEKSGARVVASHLKAKGEHYWGSSATAVTLIQRARDRGVDVWADQYPYPTSGTDGSTVLIPAWATRPPGAAAGQPPTDRAAVLKRVLGDPPTAKLVRGDIAHEIRRRGGADNIIGLRVHRPVALRQVARRNRAGVEARSGRSGDPDPDGGPARHAMAARGCAASPWRSSTWS